MSLPEELESLNKEYAANNAVTPGIIDSFKINKSKSFFSTNSLFQGRVIRILNTLTQSLNYSKAKVDSEVDLKISSAISQLQMQTRTDLGKLNSRISELESLLSQTQSKLETIDSVTKGLESIVGLLGTDKGPSLNEAQSECQETPDFGYLLLENRFRGSEDKIREKLIPYVDLIKSTYSNIGAGNKVLEVGCGRGEFLELLIDRGVPCQGLEIDTGMHALTTKKNLDVVLDDAVHYLRTSEASLLGISAFQVVEHMKYPYLLDFLSSSFAKIQKGGFLLLETINTSSLIPLMQNYFRDPTHTAPLHPDTLCFLIEQAGFKVKKIHKSAHYPKEAVLQDIPLVPELPFRYQELSRQLNSRIEVLNRLLFDSQDYAVEAYKP